LAKDGEDQQLAERLRLMAANLAAKADEVEELPTEQVRRVKAHLAG